MLLTNLLIFLQQTADTSLNITDIATYGGGIAASGGSIYLIRENIVKIFEKLNSISKKIDEISIKNDDIVNVSKQKKETMDEQKKKIEQLHHILSEENDVGQKLIHAPYFILKEVSDTQKKISEALTELTSIHKEQKATQETNNAAYLSSLQQIVNSINK